MYYVGPHVSVNGGVFNAPTAARELGATGFGMFLKNQKQWVCPDYAPGIAEAFRKAMGDYPEAAVLPHAGYLINLANPGEEAHAKSMAAFIDELKRANELGIYRVNIHPGSHLKLLTPQAACERVAESINTAIKQIPKIKVVIENTAGQGGCIGRTFEELAWIAQGVNDKSRLGFCLDTAHTFESGIDVRTEKDFLKVMDEFDRAVGIRYLSGLHLNDSKTDFGKHVDRHETLGKGYIGKEVFRTIMRDPRFENIPLILETPDETLWADEIKMLLDWTR